MSRNPRSNAGFAGLLAALVLSALTAPWTACAATTNTLSTAAMTESPRAQVVVVKDPEVMHAFRADPVRVKRMVDRALMTLTAQSDVAAAWRTFVSTQDVVGLKVLSALGPMGGTRPAVVAAVIDGLRAAGVPATNIIIWDRDMANLRNAGFQECARQYGVGLEGSAQSGYDENAFYDMPLLGSLIWGDAEFGKKGESLGRKSYVSKLVSRRLTKIINVTPLLNQPTAGVSGNLYSLAMGSVDNTARFEGDPVRLAQAVPEIYALPSLGDRVVLNIVDALLCQYQGSQRTLLHYSTVLDEIRMSRDPVALDVLSLKELDRQREATETPAGKLNLELYGNASLLELGVSDPDRIDVQTVRQVEH